jgi:hypothetical protein
MPSRAYPGWSFALEALHCPDVLFAETLEIKLTPESFVNPFGSTGFSQRHSADDPVAHFEPV